MRAILLATAVFLLAIPATASAETLHVQASRQLNWDSSYNIVINTERFQVSDINDNSLRTSVTWMYGSTDPFSSPYPTFADDDEAVDYYTSSVSSTLLSAANTYLGTAFFDTVEVDQVPYTTLADLDNYLQVTTAATTYTPLSRTVNGHALSANVTVTKSDVGLGNVDNTADASKTFAAAQITSGTKTSSFISDFATAAASAAPVTSVASKTGAVSLVKGDVGLGNVDNTSDASKTFAASQITSGTKTSAFISDFTSAARGTISAAGTGLSYNSSTGVMTYTPGVRVFQYPGAGGNNSAGNANPSSRALNTCFQVSSTQDVSALYSVNISATLTLGGGTGLVTSYTNSGCTTGAQAIGNGAVSSVALGGTSSIPLKVDIQANHWIKITASASGGGTASIDTAVQSEVFQP